MSTQTSTYSIPVSALADGMVASAWRRESPPAPSQPVFPPPPPSPSPPAYSQPAGTVLFSVGQSLEQVEREMIAKTMHGTNGNRTRAAKLLGISVRTLYTKLRTMEVRGRMGAAPAQSQSA